MAIEDLIVQSGRQISKDISEGWLGTPESRRQNRLDDFNMEQKRLLNLRNEQADQRAQESHKQTMKHTGLAIQDIERRLKIATTKEEKDSLLYQEGIEGNIIEGAANVMKEGGPKAVRDILNRDMNKFDEESQAEMKKLLGGDDNALMSAITAINATNPDVQDHLRKLKEASTRKRNIAEYFTREMVGDDGRTYHVPISRFTGKADWESAEVSLKTPTQKGRVRGAEAEAKVRAEDKAKASVAIEETRNTARIMTEDIRTALEHEGMSSVVGMPSTGKLMRYVGGSPEAGFQGLHDKIQSEAFTQMFEKIKGGGSITEREGEKATEAFSRLDTALSEKEYRQVAEDLIKEINTLAKIKERRAGISVKPNKAAIAFLTANDTEENRRFFLDTYGSLPEGF